MVDIAKCEGTDCEVRNNCYRFTAPDSGNIQSWIEMPDVKGKDCWAYWPMKRLEEMRAE